MHRVLRQRYRLTQAAWTGLETRFDALGRRAAIIGDHGRGKTTLLEDFAARLAIQGWSISWLRFNDEHRRLGALTTFDAHTILCCDGAEQLTWLDWMRVRRAARRAGGILVTTHRAGRLPTLHHCQSSPAVLKEIVWSLDDSVSDERCDQLFAAHGGNIREAIRTLYDEWTGTRELSQSV